MERIVTMRTYMKEVTEQVTEYKAIDGTIFNDLASCEIYEFDLEMKKLSKIKTCEELKDICPFDGEEYVYGHNYAWYRPETIEDIEALRMVFPDGTFKDDDVNHWICVEYDDDWAYVTSLDNCITYAKKVLNCLGYEMTVSPKTNT